MAELLRWAEVDLAALAANARNLAQLAAPARLCAVVKAGGYGHGAVEVARAALAGGAQWLAVASVEEGTELRQAGIDAPVLLLSEPRAEAMDEVVGRRLTPTIYTADGVDAAAKAVAASGHPEPLAVHVKVDTGMHRVGAAPATAVGLAESVAQRPELHLQGVCTHFAVADEPGHPFTAEQARRFEEVLAALRTRGIRPPMVHACNSAATVTQGDARHDLVRCGIALYGLAPSPALAGRVDVRPVLTLRSRVAFVKEVAAGEGVSYGLRHRPARDAVIATVPIGYADGVPWRLGIEGGEVLIGGRRRPIAGSVTMDQITVDCGADRVAPGDEVVLLGRQGRETIDAWEWARRVGTIAYEVLCGIGRRVPRLYVGAAAGAGTGA